MGLRSRNNALGKFIQGLFINISFIAQKMTPQELCDQNSLKFQNLLQVSNIKPDDFIRTTERRHNNSVQNFWTELAAKNYISMGSHEGFYSVNDEGFYVEKDLQKKQVEGKDEYYTELGEKVEWIKEDNYLFNFDDTIKQNVSKWLTSTPISSFLPQIQKDLEASHDHISISRPRSRINWGIQVPDDPSHTIYVWLDALINYKTVNDSLKDFNGEFEYMHVIGKDIAKFHGIYWPAFLSANDLSLPKEVVIHGHWKKDNLKMSKSIGNVVDPFQIIETYGINAVRAYLLTAGPQHKDANFEESELIRLYDSVIVDGFINMFFRCTGKKFLKLVENIKLDEITFTEHDKEVINRVRNVITNFKNELKIEEVQHIGQLFYKSEPLNFTNVLSKYIKEVIDIGNGYLNKGEFWTIKDAKELERVFYIVFECTRIVSILLNPYVPEISSKMLEGLNIDSNLVRIQDLDNAFTIKSIKINQESRKKLFFKKLNVE